MGFAGQLFAARVAIGLAIPSPQALSKAGQQLATGIAKMKQATDMAARRGGLSAGLQMELKQLQATTTNALDNMNNEIYIRIKRNMKNIDSATAGSVGKAFDNLSGTMRNLKTQMGQDPLGQKVFGDLGAGVEGAAGFMQKMQQVGGANMQQVMNFNEMSIRGLQDQVVEQNKLKESVTGSATEREKELKLIDEEIRKLNKQINQQKELGQYMKEGLTTIESYSGEVQEISQSSNEWASYWVGKGQDVRTKFNESIRTSISLLTVLGYKLNQNTQELIEFERELLNANSVFNLTNDNLFEVGNTITEFGNRFGIAVQNGATGLYQLASAGVSANEALSILPETLKLSMAVQGDHNTISKLTAQTLFGFGMEMNQAAAVTDKFAFAIQKSLIEYQDLSSAVKFALPFFTSTGQSIDQLLGALQILTNRALEAGIAGRGLRQALAEFAESAMDAEAGFRKMGVEILNAEGEMMQLTEIAAQFAQAVGPETASNTELLTTLIEELNVRGATAFIHLVQASDEFTQAVQDTENAGGQLDQMVKIQNESLSAQIQILKNNVFSIFAFRDASYEGTEYLNQFHEAIVASVEGFRDLIIEEKNGEQQLTTFGMKLQKFATESVVTIIDLLQRFVQGMVNLADAGFNLQAILDILIFPLRMITGFFERFPSVAKYYLYMKAINTIIPVMTVAMQGLAIAMALVHSYMTGTPMGAYFGGQGGMAAMMFGSGVVGGRGGFMGASQAGIYKKARSRIDANDLLRNPSFIKDARFSQGGYWKHHSLPGEKFKTSRSARKAIGNVTEKGGKLISMLPFWLTKLLGYGMMGGGKALQKAGGGYISPMSGGGLAGANSPYLVGEQGPELFVPTQGGQVLNTASTSNIGGNMQFRNVTIGIDSFGGLA